MARNVFRCGEIPLSDQTVVIESPFKDKPNTAALLEAKRKEELSRLKAYTGPTVESIQKEAEAFRRQFETERQQMMLDARQEADLVFEEKQKEADELIRRANEEALRIAEEADTKGKKAIADAKKKAKEEKAETEAQLNALVSDAKEKGYAEGYDLGFAKGEAEVNRLIAKLNQMVGAVVGKRKEILEESESQVIDLVLQIANRVVKVISETQKEVILQNVRSALSKVKSRTDLIIRVNLEDLNWVSQKMKEVRGSLEKVKNISVLEDATVDVGGCIVETDFGEIDARISTQLREIETKIREISPITQKER